jgi:uncharacterized membrane protein
MWFLALGCAFFLSVHLLTGGLRLKHTLIEGIGHLGYRFLFVLLSLVGLGWMIIGYSVAVEDPLNIHFYHLPVFFDYFSLLPMLLSFFLIVVGALSPLPTDLEAIAKKGIKPVHGIIRISRHPILAGIGIWSFTHFVLSGNMAGYIFFGTLFILSFMGAHSIDRKRVEIMGEAYISFMNRTSVFPFNAIMEGRNAIMPEEIGFIRPFFAVSCFCVFVALHEMLFASRILV